MVTTLVNQKLRWLTQGIENKSTLLFLITSSPVISYFSSELVTNVFTSVNSLLDLPFEGGNEEKEKIGLVEKILL